MIVTFSPRFPAQHRPRIIEILETCARAWSLQNGWEAYVCLQASKGITAEMNAELKSHSFRLDLKRQRLDSSALALDIAHELYHVLYERTHALIKALPVEYRKPLDDAFEEEHDNVAKLWAHRLFGGSDGAQERK